MRHTIVAVMLLLVAAPAAAQIGLYTSEDNSANDCNQVPPGESDVFVLVTGEWTAARFVIPRSLMGIIALEIQPLNGTTISGDFDTGFALSFAGCTTGRSAVARLRVYAVEGCGFGLLPHPDTGTVELVDCSGSSIAATWVPAISAPRFTSNCIDGGVSPPPLYPYPPNGADGVAVAVTLSWVIELPVGSCLLGTRYSQLYFGTTTSPPIVATMLESENHYIGGLEAGTTYYWKVTAHNYGFNIASPLWSFTTDSPLATEPSTWGRVKSLYK